MLRALLIIILFSFSMHAFSQFTQPMANTLTFQIIQDQFVLDNTTVKTAEIVEEHGVYRGLNVELIQPVAKIFTNMMKAGVGRRVNLVFNKKIIASSIIQSELSGKFLITEIAKDDASDFLTSLKEKQSQS